MSTMMMMMMTVNSVHGCDTPCSRAAPVTVRLADLCEQEGCEQTEVDYHR